MSSASSSANRTASRDRRLLRLRESGPGLTAGRVLLCLPPRDQLRDRVKRDLRGMRLAVGLEHVDTAAIRYRGDFADKSALADPGWANQPNDGAVALDRAVQKSVDGRHLPSPSDERGLVAAAILPGHAEEYPGRDGVVSTLDLHQLRIARAAACSTSRAVERLSISPPGGAADSIRCAMPTCAPMEVYPKAPEPISPAIT